MFRSRLLIVGCGRHNFWALFRSRFLSIYTTEGKKTPKILRLIASQLDL